MEETELSPFKTGIATLFATHLGDLLVQVTQDTVNYSSHGGSSSAEWSPDGKQKITAAAASGEHLLVAVQGGTLVLLSVVNGSLTQQRYVLMFIIARFRFSLPDTSLFLSTALPPSRPKLHLLPSILRPEAHSQ